jgi:hypothetical protein
MTEMAGAGSGSGSTDPDPDSHQKVTDPPQHCFPVTEKSHPRNPAAALDGFMFL